MTTLFSPTQFIEDALFCTTPLALSYTDPNQKWTIRHHLISLFHNCPYLRPSVGLFTHNDGTEVKLLTAVGALPVDSAPVPITIWVHELYPHVGPIVYVNLGDATSSYPIYDNHPFVDPSGATTSSYLENWDSSRSNLTDLVRNLIKLFNHNHPFYYDDRNRYRHPSSLSKTEAMDRLACTVYYDLRTVMDRNEEDIERLAALQAKLRDRADKAEILISGLDQERRRLKERIKEICEESDRVLNWLKVYGGGCVADIDRVFEGVDGKSKAMVEWSAADGAVEDLMYKLDKAFEKGIMGFGEYMKLVRVLAREQFSWRAKMVG